MRRDQLKKLRKEKGITLEQMALAVDSSKGYLWEIENKNVNPGITLFYRICKELNCSVEELMSDIGEDETDFIKISAAITYKIDETTKHYTKKVGLLKKITRDFIRVSKETDVVGGKLLLVRINRLREGIFLAAKETVAKDISDKLITAANEIDELKDFAIWMTGCGYDFCQHEYFCKTRDKLLKL